MWKLSITRRSQLTYTLEPTGTSRLVLANLDHLPLDCKAGHNAATAAVFECFSSVRVTVRQCKVLALPGRPMSRSGLDCRLMHAQGQLTGEVSSRRSVASLV